MKSRQRASILVGLLWCLAILAVVVIGFLHTTRMDLIVTRNHGDRIQAHYLALAGIERAKALLYQNARDRSRSAVNHDGRLYNAPNQFQNVKLGRGTIQVFRRGRDDEGGGIIYGISDEESRLNINSAAADEMGKLELMTPDVAAAIVDWRDNDNTVTPGGAESDYYASLQPPYLARNAPFQTLRELLMVRGVSADLLFGEDTHDNGMLESTGDGGTTSFAHQQVNETDLGWAPFLTFASTEENVSAAGEERVDAQTADESALTKVDGITPDIARAITASRGRNELHSIADLLDVQAAPPDQGLPQGGQPAGLPPNAVQPQGSGPNVISEDLLVDIGDDVTIGTSGRVSGLVNVNTAGVEVLACLPGLDRTLAQRIVSFRQSNGFLANVAWLLRVPGINRDIFKQLAPRVTVRSETYRILSEGRVTSSGVRQRVEEIVHIDLKRINTLAYREDDL